MKKKLIFIITLLLIFNTNVYAKTCPLGYDVTKDLANILNIIQILGPILVIIVTVFDVVKTISKSNIESESKKLGTRLAKRAIYCMLLFFVPIIIETGAQIAKIDVSSCALDNPTENKYTVVTTSHKLLTTKESSSNLFEAAKKADQQTFSNGYHYGDAQSWDGTNMNGYRSCSDASGTTGLTVSCDRGVALTLYYAGILKDDPYKYNLVTLNSFLSNNGWKKITNYNDIQPGDIVFYDKDHNGSLEASDHVFLVGESINQRYDWGSCDRIHHRGQYASGMPFTEGIDSNLFGWAYRKV